MHNAGAGNIRWRICYFLTGKEMIKDVKESRILNDII